MPFCATEKNCLCLVDISEFACKATVSLPKGSQRKMPSPRSLLGCYPWPRVISASVLQTMVLLYQLKIPSDSTDGYVMRLPGIKRYISFLFFVKNSSSSWNFNKSRDFMLIATEFLNFRNVGVPSKWDSSTQFSYLTWLLKCPLKKRLFRQVLRLKQQHDELQRWA